MNLPIFGYAAASAGLLSERDSDRRPSGSAFRMDGMKTFFCIWKSPAGEIGMYVYTHNQYDSRRDAKNVFDSRLLTVVPLPEGARPEDTARIRYPSGSSPSRASYQRTDGSRFVYAGRTGKARFYTVDLKNNDLYPFVAHPKAETPAFLILFIIFLVLSIAEALMLAIIIYQLRKRRPVTPTVRRV